MPNYYPFSLASILAVVLAAPVYAQETVQPAPEPSIQQGVISYVPSDFAYARPNTALDMIGRLPGFSFDGGDSVRGFAGAAGNVLIDGQRPTIKTDSLGDTLNRITIDQVISAWHRHAGSDGCRQRHPQEGRYIPAGFQRPQLPVFGDG